MRFNHKNRIPRHHLCFDTAGVAVPSETLPKLTVHRFAFSSARYCRFDGDSVSREDHAEFLDRNAFWNWLLSKCTQRNSLWVWSHNAGRNLSTLRLWELLASGELSLAHPRTRKVKTDALKTGDPPTGGVLVDSDPPTVVKCYTRSGASIVFLDVMNWLPTSMEDLSNEYEIGIPGMPGELSDDRTWLDWLQRRTEVVQRSVLSLLRFVKAEDLGNLRWTAAAQSMALFRHRCMVTQITTDDDPDVKRLERAAYVGGRCEVYYRGSVIGAGIQGLEPMVGLNPGLPTLPAGPVYHLDLTGAYPAVMRDNVFPVRYLCTELNPRRESVLERLAGQCAVASVRIDAGNEPWPIKGKEETVWKRGRFDAVLCGPELKRAIQHGDVKHVYQCQWYVADRPFGSFVHSVWEMRKTYQDKKNSLIGRLCKLLANSLHGKFSQRSHRWCLLPTVCAPKPWGRFLMFSRVTKKLEVYRCVAGHVQRLEESGEKPDNFPAIAAYTTSYARERMRELRLKAGYRQVLYEDADSIHVTEKGYLSLCAAGEVADNELGKLKVVQVAERAVYHGPKHYQLDDRVVNLGIHHDSLRREHGMWGHTNYLSLQSILNGEPQPGAVSYDEEIKDPVHPIRGRVDRDGWVHPWEEKDAAVKPFPVR